VPDECRCYGNDDDAEGHAHCNRDVTSIGQHRIFCRRQLVYFHLADFGPPRAAIFFIASTTTGAHFQSYTTSKCVNEEMLADWGIMGHMLIIWCHREQ